MPDAFDWSDYFPFKKGDLLEIELRWLFFSIEGEGEVLEKTRGDLHFTGIIPPVRNAVVSLEEQRIEILVRYHGGGAQNYGKVTIGDDTTEDWQLLINPIAGRGRVRIDPSIDADGEDLAFTLSLGRRDRCHITDISAPKIPSGAKITIRRG